MPIQLNRSRWPLQLFRAVGAVNLITKGLIGYWKFDETGGTTAFDSSPSKNNGVCTGISLVSSTIPPVKFPDPCSRAFNGTNTVVSITPSGSYSGPYTLCGWANTNSRAAGVFQTLFMTVDGGGIATVLSLNNGTNIYVALGASSGALSVNNPNAGIFPYGTNVWNHLAVTVGNTGYRVYANGYQVGGGSYASITPYLFSNIANSITIGAQQATRFFNGCMDDMRMYNRTLLASEIAQIAAGIG